MRRPKSRDIRKAILSFCDSRGSKRASVPPPTTAIGRRHVRAFGIIQLHAHFLHDVRCELNCSKTYLASVELQDHDHAVCAGGAETRSLSFARTIERHRRLQLFRSMKGR